MTGEPMHTASKERIAPEIMFLALQMKSNRRSASAINPVTMENMGDCPLQM